MRHPRHCGECGAPTWLYTLPNGNRVALDNAPGPYVIEGTKVYESTHGRGYRKHQHRNQRLPKSLLTGEVVDDDFLWR